MSDASWSFKLRLITELERPDHWHLQSEDQCAFFGEYAARQGYSHSDTNQIVTNLKKKPHLKNTMQWPHKLKAINTMSLSIAHNLTPDAISKFTFVPIPSSKTKQNADYDDRIVQIVRGINPKLDMRELLVTTTDREALHEGNKKRDLGEVERSINVDQSLTTPEPSHVVLIDDLLTTGCTFRVCSKIIRKIWPDMAIFGIFVARRVIPKDALEFEAAEV